MALRSLPGKLKGLVLRGRATTPGAAASGLGKGASKPPPIPGSLEEEYQAMQRMDDAAMEERFGGTEGSTSWLEWV